MPIQNDDECTDPDLPPTPAEEIAWRNRELHKRCLISEVPELHSHSPPPDESDSDPFGDGYSQ